MLEAAMERVRPLTLALRGNRAHVRHWLWLAASVKFLVPFSLLFYIGSLIGMPSARIADNEPLVLGDALASYLEELNGSTAIIGRLRLEGDLVGRAGQGQQPLLAAGRGRRA